LSEGYTASEIITLWCGVNVHIYLGLYLVMSDLIVFEEKMLLPDAKKSNG